MRAIYAMYVLLAINTHPSDNGNVLNISTEQVQSRVTGSREQSAQQRSSAQTERKPSTRKMCGKRKELSVYAIRMEVHLSCLPTRSAHEGL